MATMTDTLAPDARTRSRRRLVPLLVTAVLVLFVVVYLAGRGDASTTIRHGQALSAPGDISVEVDGSIGYTIPRDVAWVDSAGSYHADGRPECLPPVGIGTIPVTFATVEVKDPSGYERHQTVWVDCAGWDAAQDLSPRQAAALESGSSAG
jgi:hypothetical protein